MSYVPNGTELISNAGNFTRNHAPPSSIGNSQSSKKSKRFPRSASAVGVSRGDTSVQPIVVHSHLCWDWVWQRPQQFISRLSRTHPVLFVETAAPDPALSSALARFQTAENFPNITILRIQ